MGGRKSCYFAPNKTIRDLDDLIKTGASIDPLRDFGEAARAELQALTYEPVHRFRSPQNIVARFFCELRNQRCTIQKPARRGSSDWFFVDSGGQTVHGN